MLTISDTCTGLPNDSLKTATTFPVDYGVVLTVSCSDLGYSLFGSEYITCIKGTKFSFVVTQPLCMIGESEINIFLRTLKNHRNFRFANNEIRV